MAQSKHCGTEAEAQNPTRVVQHSPKPYGRVSGGFAGGGGRSDPQGGGGPGTLVLPLQTEVGGRGPPQKPTSFLWRFVPGRMIFWRFFLTDFSKSAKKKPRYFGPLSRLEKKLALRGVHFLRKGGSDPPTTHRQA